jgi:ATP-dependent HslUV protease ATP-binding subunit HslU
MTQPDGQALSHVVDNTLLPRELTPKQIVAELNRYIVGQEAAKRAVAIAIRNRWRRLQLPEPLRREVTPKNIIMIGPTGVGKTEIARRLAQLIRAPFLKVEATKYTEIGYVGRDVESMIRELVEVSVNLVRSEERQKVLREAERKAEEKLLDLLVPSEEDDRTSETDKHAARRRTRERVRQLLRQGVLDQQTVVIRVPGKPAPPVQIFSGPSLEQLDLDVHRWFSNLFSKPKQKREVTVQEARRILLEQEVDQLLDEDKIAQEAVRRAEESGIIFLDEIDKICGPEAPHGPDVSRQGVQRDLLPIVEGTTVNTRYGVVRTDYILFIGAGSFHKAKPSDLMPELQGRFPIRVELRDLTREDFLRILKEPENSLIRQYTALLGAEHVELRFTDDALEAMAEIAFQINQMTQNIGARRLHTVVERVLEEVSFEASELAGQTVVIDGAFVRERLEEFLKQEDLARFVL